MKKLKVSQGDLIKIPISTDEFIVCRVISEEKVSAYLVEFFKTKFPSSTKTIGLEQLGERLFRPVFFNFHFYEMEKWKVLQSNPNFNLEDADYKNIKIAFAQSLPPKIWQAGTTTPATPESLAGLETSIAWVPDSIIHRIHDHLSGKYGPFDVYPT